MGRGTVRLANREADAAVPARRAGDAGLSRRRAPARLPGLVDSHAHLQHERFDDDRDEVIERAIAAGLERLLVPGWDLPSSEAALELAERHAPLVDAAVGVHPHHAAAMQEQEWDHLEALLADPRTRVVGEIGLDYHRNLSPPDVQRHVFERQLAMAAERDLAVLVHDREAHEDVTAALLAWTGRQGHAQRGVLHAFSGGVGMAVELSSAGFLVSFALPVAFRSAAGPRKAAVALEDGRFLVETDAPYLGPDRDRRNEPTTALRVIGELARLRETTPEALISALGDAYRGLIG